ncbi:MAG: NYN domain-containing protein [Negativicutes bacterium]|nr:NYN domain-containing protein [Negativicutes bacterium]
MADILLVDGYNVINAWPDLSALKDDLEHARRKLVDILSGYGAYKDYRVVIVFDAHAVAKGKTCQETISEGLEVVFTREGETADSYIEKAAYQQVRAGHGVYVVTSDWAEQLTILGAGAWRISSRELLEAVLEADKRIRETHCRSILNHRRHELANRLGREVSERLDGMRRGRKPQE